MINSQELADGELEAITSRRGEPARAASQLVRAVRNRPRTLYCGFARALDETAWAPSCTRTDPYWRYSRYELYETFWTCIVGLSYANEQYGTIYTGLHMYSWCRLWHKSTKINVNQQNRKMIRKLCNSNTLESVRRSTIQRVQSSGVARGWAGWAKSRGSEFVLLFSCPQHRL